MADLIADPNECLSPHWAHPRKDHVKLVWHEPFEGVTRVRALAWTCDCRAVVYELLQAGGRAFIRKTIQAEPTPKVEETHRWSIEEARRVWLALLCGEMR